MLCKSASCIATRNNIILRNIVRIYLSLMIISITKPKKEIASEESSLPTKKRKVSKYYDDAYVTLLTEVST